MKKYASFRIILLTLVFGLAVAITAPAQTFQTLAEFQATDGAVPLTGLILGSDGNFYGTTADGGTPGPSCVYQGKGWTPGCGTVFQMTPTGTVTTLYSFCQLLNCADGMYPNAGLVQGPDGNFYGTTQYTYIQEEGYIIGAQVGTVFRITPTGEFTTIYNFCSLLNCADGRSPSGLILGSDGNFYGTTQFGGANGGPNNGCINDVGQSVGCGTLFKLTPSGELTTLYNFCSLSGCTDGFEPSGSLTQGSDGSFYGTAGAMYSSEIFQITPSGTETVLWLGPEFTGPAFNTPLVEDSAGNLYGTTFKGIGQETDGGTVFQLSPAGVMTTLYTFCSQNSPQQPCTDGSWPAGGVILGTDGNLYGTTSIYGAYGTATAWVMGGTVFQLTPAGVLTTLYDFCSKSTCPDGTYPSGSLIQTSNGTFYGITSGGGTKIHSSSQNNTGGSNGEAYIYGYGTVFSWSPNVAVAPTFTPATLTFPKQEVGTTSKAKSVTIKNVNTGTATLDLTGFTVSGPFAISANACGATLAAHKSCKVLITFTPTATGPATGTLTISDNAPNSPQTVTLTGTGN
jgi:uncharacterized repeat protein (TIGR03803 family)